MTANAREDESDLLRRLRAREEAAFVALIEAHHGPLRRLALAVVGSPATADDVLQDVWAAVLDGVAAFEGRSSLRTWLFRICLNRARTRRGRDARSIPFSALEGADGDDDAPALDPGRFQPDGHWREPPTNWDRGTPENKLLLAETGAFLEQTLAALPPLQRTVVTLRDVEGVSSEEVCNLLEISETNQRVLLHRGRTRLRAALAEHLGGEGKRKP